MFKAEVVDLFAGPGGWDVAARDLGLHVLGIEWDAAAVATREEARLPTIHGDVRNYGPADFTARGFIASPPCQTFSMAGKGSGRQALDAVYQGIKTLEAREAHDAGVFADERTSLVLEPLRWMLEAKDAGIPYEWAAFEQVPTVLPVWEAMADVLRREGYSVAVGKLSSEQYGVPQTRKRAILIARLDGEAALPAPTHRPYKKGTAQHAGDPALLPWISMAEALGWTDTDLVGFPRRADRQDVVEIDGVDYRARDLREAGAPSFGLTEKARSWLRISAQQNATVRATEEPAPTVAFGNDAASAQWVHSRPATAVQGDARIARPGHRCMTNDCHPGRAAESMFATGSVRVTPTEAALLQSFPADHPWQGTKTKQFQQIGNAIPPLLARAVLAAATGVEVAPPEPRPFTVGEEGTLF